MILGTGPVHDTVTLQQFSAAALRILLLVRTSVRMGWWKISCCVTLDVQGAPGKEEQTPK
eukprot:132293-Amphidinium_carterae.1